MSTSIGSGGLTFNDGTVQNTAYRNVYTPSYVNGTGADILTATSGSMYYEVLTVTGLPVGTYMHFCTCQWFRQAPTGTQQYVGLVGDAGQGNTTTGGYDAQSHMIQKAATPLNNGQYISVSKSFPRYVSTGSTSLYLAGYGTTQASSYIKTSFCSFYLLRIS